MIYDHMNIYISVGSCIKCWYEILKEVSDDPIIKFVYCLPLLTVKLVLLRSWLASLGWIIIIKITIRGKQIRKYH